MLEIQHIIIKLILPELHHVTQINVIFVKLLKFYVCSNVSYPFKLTLHIWAENRLALM